MTTKYIAMFAKSNTRTAIISVTVDGEIIKDSIILDTVTESILCKIPVTINWRGVKRVEINTIQGSCTVMHTEIHTDFDHPILLISKDNVYLNNQLVVVSQIDTDGGGEWHYDIPEHATLSFDLVIGLLSKKT